MCLSDPKRLGPEGSGLADSRTLLHVTVPTDFPKVSQWLSSILMGTRNTLLHCLCYMQGASSLADLLDWHSGIANLIRKSVPGRTKLMQQCPKR